MIFQKNLHHRFRIITNILLVILGLQASAQEQKSIFKQITNDNGLSYNTVYDICQDKQGFMWFSTEVGLNRYDGQSIKQYYSNDNNSSLPSNTIPCMVYTSDSRLFIGTIKGLVEYHPETDDFHQILIEGKSLGHLTAMQQGYGAELLISTDNNGAFVFNYENNSIVRLKSDEQIYGITTDKDGNYWAFLRFKLCKYDNAKKLITVYNASSQFFEGSAISFIKTDSKGILWIGTFEKGLFTFDTENNQFLQHPACRGTNMIYIRSIEESQDSNEYWIGTESGLYLINTKTNNCEHFKQSFDSMEKTINDNAIYKIYRNKQNINFIGTFFGGVNVLGNKNLGFNAIYPDNREGCLHGKALSAIVKAPNGDFWIATEDAGIAIFNKKESQFKHLVFDKKDQNSISSNNVHALLMDGESCWAGHFMGGISKVNISTGKTKRYVQEPNVATSLSNNFVFSLHHLSADSILVGTFAGADLYNKSTDSFSRFRENELTGCLIHDIFTAPDGKIWFCTYNKGIYILDKSKPGLMTHFFANDDSGLTNNSIISHCVDSRNQIWIGTRGSGMLQYRDKDQKFVSCNPNMLPDNVIYGIVEEDNGTFWISTNRGIQQLNFSDSTAINYSVKHGIAGNQYNYNSYFKDDGIIYFGSVTGLTWFDPKLIFTPDDRPAVYFRNLRIFNEIIRPDSAGLMTKQIDFTDKLKLKYNQNSFTFEFGVINYSVGDIAYQYFLEGFDETWSSITSQPQANYTNISYGDYIFHVRAINKINNKISAERIVHIRISPPVWKSHSAYLIYLILLIACSSYLYKNYRRRQQEKLSIAIQKIEKDNLNLLHQHKLNFFTYISHEFKTPLSVIIASVEMLVKREHEQQKDGNEILLSIKRSATLLLSLVSQLMEFRKIETDHAEIQITQGNIIDFSNQIINIYRPLLTKKSILIKVKISSVQSDICIDFKKFEKILTNLLTNAVNHTPQNGNIEFNLNVCNKEINFSVKDSGNGLSVEKKDKIFEVFYNDGFSNEIVESSGIGLALTASLINLLKGKISVESELGKGAKFHVQLPYQQTIESTHQHINKQNQEKTFEANLTSSEIGTNNTVNKEYSIVIAEDNKDLLMLLKMNFKDKYHIKCFENGKDTWDYLSEKIPDIVITDIMMPLMSGTELCKNIKSDINLCHIPVIMLTAKDTPQAKLEGLQMGADAYVAKPFSMEELEVRINNILKAQRFLKSRLSEIAKLEGLKMPITNQDQGFIEKVLATILKNIDKSDLNVQFLADKLNISRSNMHNKIKSLLEISTSEFINTVRINKAKEMIQSEDYTLSEISYKVGYSDAAYFTRIFKKITGTTPGEFRKNNKGN